MASGRVIGVEHDIGVTIIRLGSRCRARTSPDRADAAGVAPIAATAAAVPRPGGADRLPLTRRQIQERVADNLERRLDALPSLISDHIEILLFAPLFGLGLLFGWALAREVPAWVGLFMRVGLARARR
jgi:hypothetical protein